MKAPKIKVVIRYTKSEGWKDGFPVPCIKYSDTQYSSKFELDKTFKEEVIFEGECPGQLRILPKVNPQYLAHYQSFYSQIIPKGISYPLAKAVRGECYGFFDFYFSMNNLPYIKALIDIIRSKLESSEQYLNL